MLRIPHSITGTDADVCCQILFTDLKKKEEEEEHINSLCVIIYAS